MIIQRIGSASLLLVGCLLLGAANGIAADQTTTDQSAAAGADLDQVKREWAETVDALQQYSAAQRDAAVNRAEQTLDAMDRRIEELEARTRQQWGKLTQSAREARETTLQRLRMQRN